MPTGLAVGLAAGRTRTARVPFGRYGCSPATPVNRFAPARSRTQTWQWVPRSSSPRARTTRRVDALNIAATLRTYVLRGPPSVGRLIRDRLTAIERPCQNPTVPNRDRLTGLDSSFLHLERDSAHMHVAGCMVFEGPAPTYEEMLEQIESRLHLVPRYRQRLAFVPFNQGRPVWCDDPHFKA